MDFDRTLIEEVQKYPEIYDHDHKDFKNKEVKQAIWSDIAFKLKKECDEQTVKSVRNRWKSLRDSYVKETKYKMALSTGRTNRTKKDWRYAQAMSFLAPHLTIGFPQRTQEDYDINMDDKEEQNMETYYVDLSGANEGHFMGQLLDYSSRSNKTQSPSEEEPVDIYSFFKGVADTVKILSPANQVKIQRDIVNMVLDIKLQEIQQNNNV